MIFDIDSIIFIGFLAANLIFGLASSRGIKNIKEYAVGDRNFSTATISATIVATWVTGSSFFYYVSETYKSGLYSIWSAIIGDTLCLIIVGLFFAPRMGEFLGKLSIAEAMGDLYGKNVRIVTAVSGFIGASGIIAVQLKVSGLLFEYCFGIHTTYGVLIGGTVITLYSALGGIRSVTFTDVIQLFTFGTVIPIITYCLLSTLDNTDIVINTLKTNPAFDYKQVFDFSKPQSIYFLFFFFFNVIPAFNPAIFQRIAMAKNTTQIGNSFLLSAAILFFIVTMMAWISVLILSNNPSLEASNVVNHLLFEYSFIGLRGLILAGIMAMVMSTADSYVNSTSVLIVHDFCRPLGFKLAKYELLFSRYTSVLIGVFAIILAMRQGSLLQLFLATNSFYMPIVTVPFIVAVCGFRSSSKSVLIGMVAGLLSVIVWDYILHIELGNSVPVGMLVNLIFLVGSHYLLKQPGGFIGIQDTSPLDAARNNRKLYLGQFKDTIRNFSLYKYCRENSPKSEGIYSSFGIFCLLSMYSAMYTLPSESRFLYPQLMNIMIPSVFFFSTLLMSYPLWLQSWKDIEIMPLIWHIAVFYILICVGFMLVLLSNFGAIQLLILLINILVITAIARWQSILFMVIFGPLLTIKFFKLYLGSSVIPEYSEFLEFKLLYLLLLVIAPLIIFLKPKQENHELVVEQKLHLDSRIKDREEELKKLIELKNEFIRNLQHEVNTPMTGIVSIVEVLRDEYDKLNKTQIKHGIDVVANSIERFNSLASNLLNLSKLSSLSYELNKVKFNLSNLVLESIHRCKKLYLGSKELEFCTDIQENLMLYADESYIKATVDNLIINAIEYSGNTGKVKIKLSKLSGEHAVEFSVQDEGVGIPPNELVSVFEAFTVSSKTKSIAYGRGIGLALCKKVIDLHGGQIIAHSDGKTGTILSFKV